MGRHRMVYVAIATAVLSSVTASGAEKEVIGKSGGHRWEFMGMASPAAAVGRPDGRLQVPVQNGDTVKFKVDSGTHGVLFEKARSEMSAGVWEVVPSSGALVDLPAGTGFDRFDRRNAQTTAAEGPNNDLIVIRVVNLRAGLENGILFACNPHSAQGDPNQASMLGVIVLADEEKAKK